MYVIVVLSWSFWCKNHVYSLRCGAMTKKCGPKIFHSCTILTTENGQISFAIPWWLKTCISRDLLSQFYRKRPWDLQLEKKLYHWISTALSADFKNGPESLPKGGEGASKCVEIISPMDDHKWWSLQATYSTSNYLVQNWNIMHRRVQVLTTNHACMELIKCAVVALLGARKLIR